MRRVKLQEKLNARAAKDAKDAGKSKDGGQTEKLMGEVLG
jgi:hypothetical protein